MEMKLIFRIKRFSIEKNGYYWIQQNLLHMCYKFTTTLMCILIGSTVIDPVFYNNSLISERYLEMIRKTVKEFLDNKGLNTRQHWYFQQAGTPAQYCRCNSYLSTNFHKKWIGINAPSKWPARCSRNPLTLFSLSLFQE